MMKFVKGKKRVTKRGVHCSPTEALGMSMNGARKLDLDSTHVALDYEWTKSISEDYDEHSPVYCVHRANIEILRQKEAELRQSGVIKSLDSSEEQHYEDGMNKQRKVLLRSIVNERVSLVPLNDNHYSHISDHHNLISSTHILINKERMKRNKLPMCRQPELDELASKQAERIANRQGKEHSDVSDLISKIAGTTTVPIRRLGENVCGGADVDSIYNKMLFNPKYTADRNNMFDSRFSTYGTGVAKSAKGKYYICQLYKG